MNQELESHKDQFAEQPEIPLESVEDQDDGDDRPLATGSSMPDRMRYYQSRFDNDSSDDEVHSSSAFQESKFTNHGPLAAISDDEEEEQETDGEYLSMTNEYVPLNETGGMHMQNDDEDDYGDFQASHIASQLNENAIDSIIRGTLNHQEFAPRVMNDNFFYGRASNEGQLPLPSRERSSASANVVSDAVADWQPFAGTIPPESENVSTSDITNQRPSIPPLTEDKISKIKDVMSKISLKPPSISSAALADALEQSHFRMGDEISK